MTAEIGSSDPELIKILQMDGHLLCTTVSQPEQIHQRLTQSASAAVGDSSVEPALHGCTIKQD